MTNVTPLLAAVLLFALVGANITHAETRPLSPPPPVATSITDQLVESLIGSRAVVPM